jgi:aldehyde:ferredoxin oxidoreductase
MKIIFCHSMQSVLIMTDLEKSMRKQYQYMRLGNNVIEIQKELAQLQEWAEKWIIKKKGKLTISDENDIKHVLDKLRSLDT